MDGHHKARSSLGEMDEKCLLKQRNMAKRRFYHNGVTDGNHAGAKILCVNKIDGKRITHYYSDIEHALSHYQRSKNLSKASFKSYHYFFFIKTRTKWSVLKNRYDVT